MLNLPILISAKYWVKYRLQRPAQAVPCRPGPINGHPFLKLKTRPGSRDGARAFDPTDVARAAAHGGGGGGTIAHAGGGSGRLMDCSLRDSHCSAPGPSRCPSSGPLLALAGAAISSSFAQVEILGLTQPSRCEFTGFHSVFCARLTVCGMEQLTVKLR